MPGCRSGHAAVELNSGIPQFEVSPPETPHVHSSAWKRWTVGRLVATAAGTVLVLIGVLGWIGATQISSLIAEHAKERRSREVLAETVELQDLILHAETGERGYLLTGERNYLNPYR